MIKFIMELSNHYVLPAVSCNEIFRKEQLKGHTAVISSVFLTQTWAFNYKKLLVFTHCVYTESQLHISYRFVCCR